VLKMVRLMPVINYAEAKIDQINHEVFGGDANCRYFRLEMRTPDGKRRFYSLKADSKEEARTEAKELIHCMMSSFQDERIMWRMVGDKNWNLGSALAKKSKKSIIHRALGYFFDLED